MKLYREVLIESAEQAEALPIRTVAHATETGAQGASLHWVAVKFGPGTWARTDIADGLPMIDDATMVGWTALVPIVVKEVHVVAQGVLEYDMNGCVVLEQANQPIAQSYKRTEYHTAWRPS